MTGELDTAVEISKTVLHAMRYIALSDFNKLFNFKISVKTQKELNAVTEKYILCQLNRSFKTLEFYKSL
jgi:DNA repair protein RecO (recombination protein O)